MPNSICFGRQYGSGGREIAALVAKELDYHYYDKELITLSADHSNISRETAETLDEKPTSSLLYSIATNQSAFTGNGAIGYHIPANDRLYIAQSEVITGIAQTENAVFVGRCSDYFLRDKDHVLSVFIYGDNEHRISRVMQRNGCDERKAAELMKKTDKQRKNYYNAYTDYKWGDITNYNMVLDRSKLGIDGRVEILKAAYDAL